MIDKGSYAIGEKADEGTWVSGMVPGGKIYHGDCLEGLNNLDENSAILCFTSPPYFNAINYGEHTTTMEESGKSRWERNDGEYSDYRNFLINRFEALLDVIKPGGHAIVNLSPIHTDGERIPIPFHFVQWMEQAGWKFKEDIVWDKMLARDRRSGNIIQNPYPGYYYPSCTAEYVLVFQNEADSDRRNNIYHNRSDEEKEQSRIDLQSEEFHEDGGVQNNVWRIRPVSPQQNEHPAPFPRELAERVIKLYSYKGDTVLDIFGGSGNTYLAAQDQQREFIGFETQSKYVEYAKDRLQENGEYISELSVYSNEDKSETEAYERSRIYDRPHIHITRKVKYADITCSVSHTGVEIAEHAMEKIKEEWEGFQKETSNTTPKRHQVSLEEEDSQLIVKGLRIEEAREFADIIVNVVLQEENIIQSSSQ